MVSNADASSMIMIAAPGVWGETKSQSTLSLKVKSDGLSNLNIQ